MENVFLNEGEKREIKRKIDLERERDKREEKRRERWKSEKWERGEKRKRERMKERGDVVVINRNNRKVITTISSFYFLKCHCCVESFKTKGVSFCSKHFNSFLPIKEINLMTLPQEKQFVPCQNILECLGTNKLNRKAFFTWFMFVLILKLKPIDTQLPLAGQTVLKLAAVHSVLELVAQTPLNLQRKK